jgi:endonuclease/exonuclease/phosphatase family metal-dependent hydrolase
MMRVMTFNIRFDNEEDGANAWVFRKDLVTELIRKYEPSILGTQEGMIQQLNTLQEELFEYHMHAPHRVLDDTAQYPTLYFQKENFHILGGAEFWLSKTPGSHRSKDWDSAFPRMMSYARVRAKDLANPIWIAVTHLDHMGETARYEQAKIIAQWVKRLSGPVILMGDFNDHPDSDVHRLLASPDTGLKDTWQVLGYEEGASSFTHHDFHGVPRKTRMDWILATREFRVTEARIIRDHSGESYPSDHFPYLVSLEITDLS